MVVEVLYFAGVRDAVGQSAERLELPEAIRTVGALAEHLAVVHPVLQGRLGSVRLAVNEVFADADAALGDGDVIALIPPVAGG